MTPEQQRIAIAEACGWKRKAGVKAWVSPFPGGGWEYLSGLPDYLNDLNAMHDAELTKIAGELDMEYRDQLDKICGQYSIIYRATAAQRAEAFLRAVGRWEE